MGYCCQYLLKLFITLLCSRITGGYFRQLTYIITPLYVLCIHNYDPAGMPAAHSCSLTAPQTRLARTSRAASLQSTRTFRPRNAVHVLRDRFAQTALTRRSAQQGNIPRAATTGASRAGTMPATPRRPERASAQVGRTKK